MNDNIWFKVGVRPFLHFTAKRPLIIKNNRQKKLEPIVVSSLVLRSHEKSWTAFYKKIESMNWNKNVAYSTQKSVFLIA